MKIQPGLDNYMNLVKLLLWNFHNKPSEKLPNNRGHQKSQLKQWTIKGKSLQSIIHLQLFDCLKMGVIQWSLNNPRSKKTPLSQTKAAHTRATRRKLCIFGSETFGSVPLPLMWSYFLWIRAKQAGFRETYTTRTTKSWGHWKTRQLLGGSSH